MSGEDSLGFLGPEPGPKFAHEEGGVVGALAEGNHVLDSPILDPFGMGVGRAGLLKLLVPQEGVFLAVFRRELSIGVVAPHSNTSCLILFIADLSI